jgi:hypothetical protein
MSLLKNIKQIKNGGRSRQVKSDNHAWPSDSVDSGNDFVSNCIRLIDSEPEKSRAGVDHVHISTLIGADWCPRAHLINLRHSQNHFENVLPQMRIVWALGRAAELHVRNQFIKAHGRHRIIGKWKCRCGESIREGVGAKFVKCSSCGTAIDNYHELLLREHDLNVVGSPDLVFIAADGGYEVVEIKSIKKDSFVELNAPKFDHVMQCYGYVDFLRRTTGLRVDGRILYVAKDFISPRQSPYREFPIAPQEAAASQVMASLRDGVTEMREHQKSDSLPERLPACSSPASKRAKSCVACTLCFSL